RSQSGDFNGDIDLRLESAEQDQVARQVDDLHRLAHVQDVDVSIFTQSAGLQHKLNGLRNGHEVAGDVGMGNRNRSTTLDLTLEVGHDAPAAAQHIAEADGDEALVGPR